MEDADEAVGELAEGGLVADVSGAELFVVPWRLPGADQKSLGTKDADVGGAPVDAGCRDAPARA